VYVVEGERDVHTLEAQGVTATCNPGGANKWKDEYTAQLAGASRVLICFDRDDVGRRHALQVGGALEAAGIRVSYRCPAAGKDVTDHFEAGRRLKELEHKRPRNPGSPKQSEQQRRDRQLGWVGRALADARVGNRHERCVWLATQLRDNGYLEADARVLIEHYQHESDDDPTAPFPLSEALAVLTDIYKTPARAPVRRKPSKRLTSIPLSDIEREDVEWLWPHQIPYGHITEIKGDPGTGKSLITLDLAARVSKGGELPDGTRLKERADVVIVCGEDRLEDTVAPRLDVLDADPTRIFTVALPVDAETGQVVPLTVPEDLNGIEEIVIETNARLLIIDPISAYLSQQVDSHKDASVRKALTPLADFAHRRRIAVVLVRHLNKSGDLRAIYRGGGSIAFTAAVRSSLVVERHPDKRDLHVLARVKQNLTAPGPAQSYYIRATDDGRHPVIDWTETLNIDVDTLLRGHDARTDAPDREEAIDLLKSLLRNGPMLKTDVLAAAREAGVSMATLRNAKRRLGVRSEAKRRGNGVIRAWEWSLPNVTARTIVHFDLDRTDGPKAWIEPEGQPEP
jgi:RecA-family ATPase